MELAVHKYQTNSTTIFYEVAGKGEPLVLLHGLSGSSRWWSKNVDALARRFRVHLVDLIGFGRSRGQPFMLAETASKLAEWLDQTGLKRANLIGHSMGGYITIDLAANYPHLVDKIILVDPLAVPIGRRLHQNAWGLMRGARVSPPDFFPVLFNDVFRAGPLTLVKAIREVLAADIRHDLAKITAPTLIMWGQHDYVLPIRLGHALQELMPSAEYVVIENAGHNPMWDQPEQFNQIVTRFLTEGANGRRLD